MYTLTQNNKTLLRALPLAATLFQKGRRAPADVVKPPGHGQTATTPVTTASEGGETEENEIPRLH